MDDTGRHGDTEQLVTFHLGRETYGVEISRIQEVIHYREVTTVPGAPEFIDGVIDLRDRLVPVVDLRRRLDLASAAGEKRRIVILDLEDRPLGIVVDDISQVLLIAQSQYEALPEAVVGDQGSSCIDRLAKTDDGLIIVIEPERILTYAERRELSQFEVESDGLTDEPDTDTRTSA